MVRLSAEGSNPTYARRVPPSRYELSADRSVHWWNIPRHVISRMNEFEVFEMAAGASLITPLIVTTLFLGPAGYILTAKHQCLQVLRVDSEQM